MNKEPKILVLDIETSPLEVRTWRLGDVNIQHTEIIKDSEIIAWGAKWYNLKDPTVIYDDLRKSKKINIDKAFLKRIHSLMKQADILVTQNGKAFDEKRLNAKFIEVGLKPVYISKHIDTVQIARRKFGFTSNKLDYLSNKLCKKYKKLKHEKYPGNELWVECAKGNQDAWKEMERYNKRDVLSLEELYSLLQPWDKNSSFHSWIVDGKPNSCECGRGHYMKDGYIYTQSGKFQKFQCSSCGTHKKGKDNLLSKEQRKSMLSRV